MKLISFAIPFISYNDEMLMTLESLAFHFIHLGRRSILVIFDSVLSLMVILELPESSR